MGILFVLLDYLTVALLGVLAIPAWLGYFFQGFANIGKLLTPGQ